MPARRRAQALDYVAGYTCLNDVSARDLQYADKQFTRAKSLDTFWPMGPWLVTADEIADPQALAIRCLVNGEMRQDSNTADMVFSVAQLVSFCSQAFTLEPGDVIATGTPGGVGWFREPRRCSRTVTRSWSRSSAWAGSSTAASRSGRDRARVADVARGR